MTRGQGHLPVLLLLALSCGAPPGSQPPAGSEDQPWPASGRLSAATRAIRADSADGYGATLPAVGLRASFDHHGPTLRTIGKDREGLSPRLVGWGRETRWQEAAPVAPALGACAGAESTGDCHLRLEYARPGLVEWWAAQEQGLEFGFTLDEPPAGEGLLELRVALDGARSVEQRGGGAHLLDADGRAWTVSEPLAWDATGKSLDARLRVEQGNLVLELALDGAMYPVELDPVLSSASATLTGDVSRGYFGWAVSGVGDMNGDGYGDVVVSAPEVDGSSGAAYVYLGSVDGLESVASATLTAPEPESAFGWSIAGAGDVNGDGYDDLVVGAPYAEGSSAGAAYLYFGSADGLSAEADATISAPATKSYFGWSVSGAGDVNGDGYDDLVVGAPYYQSYVGVAYVFHGSTVGPSATPDATLEGPSSEAVEFGAAVAGAGDVDGDGYDDVVVGAPLTTGRRGAAYVHRGSADGMDGSESDVLPGTSDGGYHGASLAGVGDIDGDGYDDVVVGAYLNHEVHVYPGSADGPPRTPTTSLVDDSTEGGNFGLSVAGAGDVDGDGYADVVVGAPGDSATLGAARLYAGSSGGLSETAVTSLAASSTGERFGRAVAGAGDINGDGFDDIAVASPYADTYTGAVGVYLGYTDDADGDGALTEEDCDDEDPTSYPGAEETCDGADQDCDGEVDEDAADAGDWYTDGDGDGYGDPSGGVLSCEPVEDRVADHSDCDDDDAAIHPGAEETPDDGIDQDCDGADATASGGDSGGGDTNGGGDTSGVDTSGVDTNGVDTSGDDTNGGVDGGADKADPGGCGACSSGGRDGRTSLGLLVLIAALVLGMRGGRAR